MKRADAIFSLDEVTDDDLAESYWGSDDCHGSDRGCHADLYDVLLGSDDEATCLPAAAALLRDGAMELSVSAACRAGPQETPGQGTVASAVMSIRSRWSRLHAWAAG